MDEETAHNILSDLDILGFFVCVVLTNIIWNGFMRS